jgi:hypothetical protein
VLRNGTMPGWQHIYLLYGLLTVLSPLLRPTAQKKGFLSKYYCSWIVQLVNQELWWRCTVRLMLLSYLLIKHLHSMDQRVIFFKNESLQLLTLIF